MKITEYSQLEFHPEFYSRMTSSEQRSIGGREGAVVRIFEIQGWPDKVKKIEVAFIAPTVRHKTQTRTYDMAQFERWIDGGLVIVKP